MVTKAPGYFSAERDQSVIRAGGFFCESCLVAKLAAEKSADKRYCQSCFDNINEDMPKAPTPLPGDRANFVPAKGKRGRPPQTLPEGIIRDLAARGKSSRVIAQELESRGYDVNYKSVQRVLRACPFTASGDSLTRRGLLQAPLGDRVGKPQGPRWAPRGDGN